MELYRGGSQIITGFGQSSGVGNFDLASARPLEPVGFKRVWLVGERIGLCRICVDMHGQYARPFAFTNGSARALSVSLCHELDA